MCNFCREVTALRIWQRSGILSTATAGFDTWVSQYRTPFYGTYGFKVPAKVPQSRQWSYHFHALRALSGTPGATHNLAEKGAD